MNKKAILPILLMLVGFGLSSCSNNGKKNPSINDSVVVKKDENTPDFELTLEVLTDATYSFDFGTSGDIKWSSDNESVATVDNGFIIGKSAGQANIVCECGIDKKMIQVTVVNHGYVPNIDFGLIEDVINLNVNRSFKLAPVLTYINKVYDDALYSYSSSDDNIAIVDENGNIKAKSEGNAVITVVAEWRGFDSKLLTFELPVTIA